MRTKRAFKVKEKTFFIILKGLPVARNCLIPESGPLSKCEWTTMAFLISFVIKPDWYSCFFLNRGLFFLLFHKFFSKCLICEFFIVPLHMIIGSCFLKYVVNTVTVNLWKSESPVSILKEDWELRDWLVKMRSMHVGLS